MSSGNYEISIDKLVVISRYISLNYDLIIRYHDLIKLIFTNGNGLPYKMKSLQFTVEFVYTFINFI